MRIFTEENFAVIVSAEGKNIPGIRRIWVRDKNQRKTQAHKELSYLYFFNDYRSPYYSLAPAQRHQRLVQELGMPEGWEVDEAMKEATKQYLELILQSEATRSLAAVKAGLVSSTEVLNTLRAEIDKHNQLLREWEQGDTEENKEGKMLLVIDLVDKLIKLSQAIPKAIATVKQLEEDVKKEQSSDLRIRGGGGRGDFED